MPTRSKPATPAAPKTAREMGLMQGFPPPPGARPDPMTWDLAPMNRWAFLNMRSMFPTTDVRRGDGTPSEMSRSPQELGRIPFTGADGGALSVRDWLEQSYTDGFLVMHKGQIVSEQYFNDMAGHTPHLSQSVAKSFVGALAGTLEGEGLIDPAALITDLIPELAQSGYAGATLDQVLDMRSGARFTEDYGLPNSDMTRIDIACGWRPTPEGQTRPTIRDVIQTLPLEREHGGAFQYRSIETDVVAWALERTAQAPLAELLSSRIWQKIGAERDAFFTVDAAGTALADGGFNATMRDYARFGAMLLAGGEGVVPEAWINATRQGDPSAFGAPYTNASPNGAYRNQWWIHDAGRGDIMARGVFGQLIYLDFDTDFMAVKLSTWPDYLIEAQTLNALAGVIAIRDSLSG
ncbi:MAG: serine hydrolase [Planctomycetota bacterium]|nr:serine hydrolase [Planctomycetota bacterium]